MLNNMTINSVYTYKCKIDYMFNIKNFQLVN